MLRALASIADNPHHATAGPAVRRLALRDFRNYARLRVELDAAPVVLVGENGAGKTNLLEAISLLAPGRGLRRAKLADMDRQGGGAWSVEARLQNSLGPTDITSRHEPTSERRLVAIDDDPVRSQASLGELVGILWLTPAFDRLFSESPGSRRRFLDRLVLTINPRHASHVSSYERAMRDRSILLRERRGDPAWLSALERRMCDSAVAVAAARVELVDGLAHALGRLETSFPIPALALDGEVEGWVREMPAVDAEQRLADALTRSRPLDAEQGGASHGIHRGDLLVSEAATATPAASCSTGRQKSLLVSIVLAQAHLALDRQGELPILLLDEVTAHLDQRRRHELFETLLTLGAQAWLTGTDADLFSALRGAAQFFHVHEATLNRHE
jgi:DNA replication and repair protein RecF